MCKEEKLMKNLDNDINTEHRPLTPHERNILEDIYYTCCTIIKANIRKYIDDPYICDDCEQETYLRAAEHIDSFMSSPNKVGWLVKASTIVALTTIKKNKRRSNRIISIDNIENTLVGSIDSNYYNPEDKEKIIIFMKKHLSKRNGNFFELVVKSGKSNKELAELLNTTESAIRSKWKRMIDEIMSLPDEIKEKLYYL